MVDTAHVRDPKTFYAKQVMASLGEDRTAGPNRDQLPCQVSGGWTGLAQRAYSPLRSRTKMSLKRIRPSPPECSCSAITPCSAPGDG